MLLLVGEKCFYSALKRPLLQEYSTVASPALDPDVSTQSHNLPLVAAARVLLSQTHYIPKLQLHEVTAPPLAAD